MLTANFLVNDRKILENKISKMKKGGAASLHVITDFDRTLTKMAKEGYLISTSYDPINERLDPKFKRLTDQMTEHYLPIELSKKFSLQEKSRKMEEWWGKYFALSLEYGMRESIILDAVKSMKINFRPGARRFLDILDKQGIPLLIFSAGVGNIIRQGLKSAGKLTPNIHIISNFFEYDAKGKAIGYTRPLIHTFNKNESQVKNSDYASQIVKRKNLILLGDSLGDPGMADGMEHECVIKIGFYNHAQDESLQKKYLKCYDVLIMNNAGMEYVNGLLKEIVKR